MKKVLLSIMTSALLVVGCQDYDDQFSSLESQISALATTVAGLSQVQSDLASLAGTVSSLATTVNGLGDTIDTAVSDGLTDIQADIDAIETAVADVASSEEVSSLSDAVDAAQSDLTDLLANSSVFTGDVIINNSSTLDAFNNMGSTLAIVNGYVDIDVTAAMDIAKVQSVVDNILTTTGDFSYNAAALDVAGVTFNNLSGTQTLTLEQADGYEAKALVSAGNIVLMNTYASKVDIIDFRELTSLTSIGDGTAGQLDFTAAAEVHLTKIAYYPGGALTVNTKADGVIDITALTDTNASAVVAPFTLTIDGPASLTISNIAGDAAGSTKGAITLTNVATANISGFGGTITLGSGVENATLANVATSPVITAADDLTVFSVTGVTNYGKSYNTSGSTAQAASLQTANFIDLAFTTTQNDLTTLTVAGSINDLDITGTGVETLVIDGINVNTLDIEDNSDLTSISATAAKINDLDLINNDDLLATAIDYDIYTTVVASTATADAKGDLNVTGNAKLASLTIHAKSLNDLDIHTNAKLATVSFPFLVAAGQGTSPDVDIYGNKFSASSVTDNYDATAAGAAVTGNDTTNTGSYTSTSGLSGLNVWIAAAITATNSTASNVMQVWFDNVAEQKVVDVNGVVTTTNPGDTTAAAQIKANAGTTFAVVYVENVITTGRTTKQAVSIAIPVIKDANGSDTPISITAGTDAITVVNGTGGSKTFAGASTNTIRTVTDLVAAINGDTTVAGVTVEADRDAFHQQINTISYVSSNGLQETTSSTAGKLYFTYGTDPETGAAIATQTANMAAVASGGIAAAIATAFNIATSAYHATATTDGNILVTALASGTLNLDRGPIPHAFNTLTLVANTASSTKLFGGDLASIILQAEAASNTTALASGYFTLSSSAVTRSGIRVTVKNNSTSVSLASMAVTMSALSSALKQTGAAANALDQLARPLAAGTNMVAASINSSSLDYVAAFSDVESPASTTPTVTNRTGW
jgi:hypothetical protein